VPLVTSALQSIEAVGGGLTAGTLTLTQAAAAFLRWMEAHGYAKNTLESYGRGLSAFLRYAGGINLRRPEDVSILALDGYLLWLRDHGRSARTAAHHRSVLVALWAWLEHEGLAERNVPAKTYPVKYQCRAPVYLEAHQIDDFLAKLAALTDLIGRRDHAMVATLFYGGLRVGELASLRPEHVDLTARRIRVLHGKGDRDRVIVLPPRLAPILEAYLRDVRPQLVARRSKKVVTLPFPLPPAYLFVHARLRRGGAALLTRSIFQTIADRTQTMLGVRLSPHKLRHTCATYLLMAGAQLETIQRHLGHQDVKTTMVYLHVPQRRQEDEIGRAFA
jgi:site-specific recombinase XerD